MRKLKLILFSLVAFTTILAAQVAHSVTITWTPNTSGDPVTTYNILRSTTSGTETVLGTVSASTCTLTCSYIDSTVIGGTTYFYEITATNSGGTSAPSPEVTANIPFSTPNAPSKPTLVVK